MSDSLAPKPDRSPKNGPPIILVTNDDGLDARGIAALAQALIETSLGEVVVIAPDRDNSAVSHSISLHQPLRAREDRPGWIAVQGTPTDCVYLGAVELLPRWPSLVHPKRGDSALAARFAAAVARRILTRGLPPGMTLNINVPDGAPESYQLTFLGRRPYAHSVHKRADPRGRVYYWIGGDPAEHEDLPGSDCNAVAQGLISVTPLIVDMTDLRWFGPTGAEVVLDGWRTEPPISPPSLGRTELDPKK